MKKKVISILLACAIVFGSAGVPVVQAEEPAADAGAAEQYVDITPMVPSWKWAYTGSNNQAYLYDNDYTTVGGEWGTYLYKVFSNPSSSFCNPRAQAFFGGEAYQIKSIRIATKIEADATAGANYVETYKIYGTKSTTNQTEIDKIGGDAGANNPGTDVSAGVWELIGAEEGYALTRVEGQNFAEISLDEEYTGIRVECVGSNTSAGIGEGNPALTEFHIFAEFDESYDVAKEEMQLTSGIKTIYSNCVLDNLKDGDITTDWHTQSTAGKNEDKWLAIGFNGEEKLIDGLRLLPRAALGNGTITGYEIYVTQTKDTPVESITDWEKVAEGTWAVDRWWKNTEFDPVNATYVKLKATSTSGDFISAAEVRVTTPKIDDGAGNEVYRLDSYKGDRLPENWIVPQAEAGKAFVGWYKNPELTQTCGDATTGLAYPKYMDISVFAPTKVDTALVSFRGGSLRRDTPAVEKTSLRFGYDLTMLGTVDETLQQETGRTAEWKWQWGKDGVWNEAEEDLVVGSNITTEGQTNLVITGIPASAYETKLNCRIILSYTTPDGTEVTEVMEEAGQERSVADVARAIVAADAVEGSNVPADDKTYADNILAAIPKGGQN